ncbi:WD40/YVTN repeat-like-containing domain [Arthroderma uncinatum]|uniref:WD40/YVTN repeat-like-containing domain n=1 Tax=Arthroderma uncinatum TaxID=74035 RepID=UPI00144A55EF|nr:WD40/YVTN repeat-like-containing domain [Arthroderma uncinatum]KAF3479854.1 WD40/YVTN repeat-like-containing domain [Arthroderma uncinatum]
MSFFKKVLKSKKKPQKELPEGYSSGENWPGEKRPDKKKPDEEKHEGEGPSEIGPTAAKYAIPKGDRGLNCVYRLEEPSKAVVDIVFVHGLTGSSENTWTHPDSNLHWPRQLLKEDIPNARIFTFGYDADVASFWGGASQNRLTNHAENMIKDLVDERSDTKTDDRELLFVAHSLGGLVVERALQLSSCPKEQHLGQIEKCTHGIVFLGTPHSGSDFAPFAKALAQTLRACGKRVNTNILETLKRDSETLLDVEDWFATWLRTRSKAQNPVNITCFFEELELPVVGKVVPEGSARIPGYPLYGIHADHRNMTKVVGREDLGYKSIRGVLRIWVNGLSEEHRKKEDHITQNEINILNRLSIASEAAFDSIAHEHDPFCLENTRESVLEEIYTWANGDSDQCIFWLCGMAGTGKSTISRTTAREFSQIGNLGASFFFSRGGKDVRNAEKFIPTIAKQFATRFPAVRGFICGVIEKQPDIFEKTRRDQWKNLVIGPLSKYTGPTVPLVVVLDALDEFEGDKDIQLILQLLTEAADLKTIRLRILLTSRPETPIRLGFRKMKGGLHYDFVLHEMPLAIVDSDMKLYFRDQFSKIRDESERLDEDWPGDDAIDDLTRKAGGLFIYAATVCGFINTYVGRWSAQVLLEGFLPNRELKDGQNETYKMPSGPPTFELDSLYLRVLKHSMRGVNDEDKLELTEGFKNIIGSIVILFEPFTPTSLENLLAVPEGTVYQNLYDLHSVLRVPDKDSQTIRLLHASFRDFLLDDARCRDKDFWIDGRKIHKELALKCISLLEVSFKRDICSIRAPGTLLSDISQGQIDRCLPPEVKYACLHWIRHLEEGGDLVPDNGNVHTFLKKHFLHWLESLVLLQKTADGVLAISALEVLVERQKQEHAEEATTGKVQEFEGHSNFVFGMDFSPDSHKIASSSSDRTVRIWEVATRKSLQILNHSGTILNVAFSPNGSKVASACDDHTVRIWEVATNKEEEHSNYSSWVNSVVAFSPNGSKVASSSHDATINIWEVATGELQQTLSRNTPNALVFSPDNSTIMSASNSCKVSVWDVATGNLQKIFKTHYASVRSLAFSPDGNKIISGSDDRAVHILEMATEKVRRLEGHSRSICSVAFSPDGSRVASGSEDCTVRIWDEATGELQVSIATGKLAENIMGFSALVSSIAFLSKNTRVMLGFDDHTVQIRDTDAGGLLQAFDGYSPLISSIPFLPTSGRVMLGFDPHTANVWDVATETINSASVRDVVGQPTYSMDKSSQWITMDNLKILYIPVDFRPGAAAIRNRSLALGTGAGRTTILTFLPVIDPIIL